jgi:hypothetical protein
MHFAFTAVCPCNLVLSHTRLRWIFLCADAASQWLAIAQHIQACWSTKHSHITHRTRAVSRHGASVQYRCHRHSKFGRDTIRVVARSSKLVFRTFAHSHIRTFAHSHIRTFAHFCVRAEHCRIKMQRSDYPLFTLKECWSEEESRLLEPTENMLVIITGWYSLGYVDMNDNGGLVVNFTFTSLGLLAFVSTRFASACARSFGRTTRTCTHYSAALRTQAGHQTAQGTGIAWTTIRWRKNERERKGQPD